jgi:hypothetical protein
MLVILESIKTRNWLFIISMIIICIGLIYPYGPSKYFLGVFLSRSDIYDQSLIQTVKNISNFVPNNETLVISTSSIAPTVEYFSGHPVEVPYTVDSRQSLVDYMSQYNFTYIVVPIILGSSSSVEKLRPIFSFEGLQKLNENFQRIEDFKTNSSEIYLYKKK